MTLIADSNRGIYGPQQAAKFILATCEYGNGEDLKIVAQGPDHAEYWNAWLDCVDAQYSYNNSPVFIDENDGDIFLH